MLTVVVAAERLEANVNVSSSPYQGQYRLPPKPKPPRNRRLIILWVVLGALLLGMSTSIVVTIVQNSVTPAGDAAPSLDPNATPPKLLPYASAEVNQEYFDWVNLTLLQQNEAPTGEDFVNALVAAGFEKSAMELTDDETAVGLDADSIQFSVLWNNECLVGQFGVGSAGYRSAVLEPVTVSTCLVGQTRPINW